jgi:2'-5' RNA ligase
MEANKSLYMFAIMPPGELAQTIHAERIAFAQKYDCQKALKPPVHITLYPPFSAERDLEEKAEALRGWVSAQASFVINLHNYDYFKDHRSPIVYIDVLPNQVLNDFYNAFLAQLQELMPTQSSETYKPHFTIGYRDVPRQRLPEIVAEYSKRTFTASFEVTSIFLWKHDGKKWNVLKEFELKSAG